MLAEIDYTPKMTVKGIFLEITALTYFFANNIQGRSRKA